MNPNERTTGRMPEMLQDCDRKLSRALSNTPDARLHAREAAAAASLVDPSFRHEPNCGARFATAGECTCGVAACDGGKQG